MKVMAVFAILVIGGIGALIMSYGQTTAQTTKEPLQPGTSAPLFALPDQNNTIHKLEDLRGKIVVLAFYPADMTKGCTIEAHNLTKALKEFEKRGVALYGISVQDVNSKKKFCDTEGIKYPLLADTEKAVSRDYGVLSAIGVAKRVTFVIDKEGKIAALDPKVNPATVAVDTLKLVDEVIARSK